MLITVKIDWNRDATVTGDASDHHKPIETYFQTKSQMAKRNLRLQT